MSIEEPRAAAPAPVPVPVPRADTAPVPVPVPRADTAPGAAPSFAPTPPARPDLFGGRAPGPSDPGGWAPGTTLVPGQPAPTGTWPALSPNRWALPAPPAPPTTPRVGSGALSVTGLVLGALGVGLGWIPVISFPAVLIALAALVCVVVVFARTTAPRPRATWAALAVAVAALVVSLVGSVVSVGLIADRLEARRQVAAPISAPVRPDVPARPAPAASPGAVPLGVTNYGPGPERIFLTVVRRSGVVVTDERAAIDLGYGVCGLIVRGVPRQQIYEEVADASGLPRAQAAGVAGAAIGSFCPLR